ncbi:sugar ABC transporter permease [Aureimonas fodinaquatilis]|uniref:Sugar ABC transporter permease n=1 Tax=Aureimonas fodinaquatilis TaxID=2565783 RepID=A0A5B0E207_9HYPH|nr:sugar ABC transporter permease [Aureimonas fodinaquatilis]KAA0971991.1 sugar ABC transporter permease [Aureimonas fodinaquatilis]
MSTRKISPGLWFILPTMLVLIGLIAYPMLSTIELSVTNASGAFVGLRNFNIVINSPSTLLIISNTLVYVFGSVFLQLVLGIAAGILLNQSFVGRSILRSLMLVPWIIPGIVAAMTWAWMFHTDYGIINYLLTQLGIISQPVGWLTNPNTVMPALIAVNAWKMFPFVAVMVLAGLQSVPDELYEASRIDGAEFRHEVWHVMLPQLRPVLFSITLLLVIWALDGITIIYSMTGGGPANRSMIFPIHIYVQAFEYFEFNRAAALSVLYFGFISIVIAIYMRLFWRDERN